MSKHKKSLIAVAVCALMLGASALLPADLSLIGTSYAAGNGDGSGNGAGNGKPGDSSGQGAGLSSDHTGTAKRTRDHGVSGKHTGTTRATAGTRKSQGSPTSSTANNRDTRGLTKSSAVSNTTPGTHNTKGQNKATSSSIKNDR